MTLKELLASLRKSQSKRCVRPQSPSISRGTAFLDQQRFLPHTLEKHYIGSMLYAFNFAEETQRAEGGRPLKVVRVLADDLGQGSYVHKPTDEPSPHESVHEMWVKMFHIKAKFTAVYGHEPGIINASMSISSDSSLSLYDDTSESDVAFDAIVEKRALSTIEELSECSASVQVPAEDVNLLQGDFTSLAGLSTRLVPSISKEDFPIHDVVGATNDLEAFLQSSDLDARWLDYSVSSDTEEDCDATSSIDVSIEDIVEEITLGHSFPKKSDKNHFEDRPSAYIYNSLVTPIQLPVQVTKSFVVLSGHRCTPAFGLGIDSVPSPHSSAISKTVGVFSDSAIARSPTLGKYNLAAGLDFGSPSTLGFLPSTTKTDMNTFVGGVEIVLDVAEAFSKVDSLTGNRDLPDLWTKPRKSKSMSNLIRKVLRRTQRPERFDDGSFDLTPASPSASLRSLSRPSTSELSKGKISINTKNMVDSSQRSVSSSRSSVSL